MPRRKKGQQYSGGPYGSGVAQRELDRTMPAPAIEERFHPNPAAQALGAAAGAPPHKGGSYQPGDDTSAGAFRASPEQLLAAAQAMKGRAGLLAQPSNRPNEPVTAGLPGGPGPGPEAMQMRTTSPGIELMRNLTQWTGDPYFARLVERG